MKPPSPQYTLLALALGNNALYFIQTTIGTWRTVFDHIAADLARATTLASFRSSPLDALRGSNAMGFEACFRS